MKEDEGGGRKRKEKEEEEEGRGGRGREGGSSPANTKTTPSRKHASELAPKLRDPYATRLELTPNATNQEMKGQDKVFPLKGLLRQRHLGQRWAADN